MNGNGDQSARRERREKSWRTGGEAFYGNRAPLLSKVIVNGTELDGRVDVDLAFYKHGPTGQSLEDDANEGRTQREAALLRSKASQPAPRNRSVYTLIRLYRKLRNHNIMRLL